MTTHIRTLLLLGFTGLAASLSGCILETTGRNNNNNGGGVDCVQSQYFQVYWSIDNGAGTAPLTCTQAPASHVELVTNNGTFPVGVECRATSYMGFVFDFAGSTNGVPAGTYVKTADLISDTTNQVVSSAPGAGPAYAISACTSITVAYPFSL